MCVGQPVFVRLTDLRCGERKAVHTKRVKVKFCRYAAAEQLFEKKQAVLHRDTFVCNGMP